MIITIKDCWLDCGNYMKKSVDNGGRSDSLLPMQSPNETATTRQTFALFCNTGYDVRACGLSRAEASAIIAMGKSDAAIARTASLSGAVHKKTVKAGGNDAAHRALFDKAWAAGMDAGKAVECIPMIVRQHANPLDDRSPVVKTYEPVMDGVCGFASVEIRPATSSFAKWLLKTRRASKSYRGGLGVFIGEHRQSLTRKEAHAMAMAAVLCEAGLEARCDSRID